MIDATINGIKAEFPRGVSVLEAARSLQIEIPTLCDDPRLIARGPCRMCLVDIAGNSRPVVSCMTELKPGMDIRTDSPTLHDARRMNLRMLARKHPSESVEGLGEKPFHKLVDAFGLSRSDFEGSADDNLFDDLHPYIRVDMSRCIDCYRCVRICEELPGQNVWQVVNRGQSTHIVPDGPSLRDSSCISCGACVDTCPTGALEDKSVLARGPAVTWTKTVCPYCGTGCEMNVGEREGKIVQVKPALEAPVSRGHLCVKGRYAFDFVDAADRITEPMIRENEHWRAVSWDDAIGFVVDRMKAIRVKYGADSLGILGSARATNEENYLIQKFARVVVGTNNVDSCARVCHTPSALALKMVLGTGAATNSFADIEIAKTILICGANPTENHPIVGERIKQAAKRGDARLIVIDPRATELTKYAAVHLQLRPGTNVLLLNAIAHTIIEEGLVDAGFVDERVSAFEKFRAFISDFAPEAVASRCGVSPELIRLAARIYANGEPSMCFHGLGLTEHVQGTEGVMCLINLALLTGNIGKPGTGVNPLRGQNNVQGAAHMGCDPGILTGSIALEQGRAKFEEVWKAPIPTSKGRNFMHMMDAAAVGDLKALWAIGYDVFLSSPDANTSRRSLESLELLVVQDMFLNETAREFGHVFLPASSSFEKDGTFMNAERRVQRVRKVIAPRGSSRSDSEIVCDVARRFGAGAHFDFESAEDIWNEIRMVWKESNGITYGRLENGGLQWPCMDESDPGTSVLYADSFGVGDRAELRRISIHESPEKISEAYPFLLATGRTLYQFNAGTMTSRTKNNELRPTDLLMIHPVDAAPLGIVEHDLIRVASAYGEATLPATLSTAVRTGELFATFHTPAVFLNYVTGPHRDRFAHSPEYKVTAVRLERVGNGSA